MKQFITFENFVNENKANDEETLSESFSVEDCAKDCGAAVAMRIADPSKRTSIDLLQAGHIQWVESKKALVEAYPSSRGGNEYYTIVKCDEDEGNEAIKQAIKEFGGKNYSDRATAKKDIIKFLKSQVK